MEVTKFLKLSAEEQQKEIDNCKSFEYFYNNYCKRDGMPEYSEEVYQEYLENINKQRFSRRRSIDNTFYPLTPEECFKL
ncbi:MAG TPA: hypothetical protein VLA48_03465 [Nitrososphaeraceae archaeon]|nr:hypothetical protein [Nitrososphaeraceae archaeon]